MKLFIIAFVALVVAASALPVSNDLDIQDLLDDDSNDVSDLQAAVQDSQQASEKQESAAMADILQQQAARESNAAAAMQKALLFQNKVQDNDLSLAESADTSLAVTGGYIRANPSINQYSFSSCHAGDAPGSGHCRPQIDSPQGWSSQPSGSGWMSIDLQAPTRVAGVLLQGRSSSCGCNQWLTRIRIFTSPNNVDWIDQGVYTGNNDQDSKVNVILAKPTVTRYVKIVVVSVSNHASARWDVLKTEDQSSLTLDLPQYMRASPSINQYAFSSCHAGDAPGTGHCRPQIDSDQGWSSQPSNSGWMSIDLRVATRVSGILLQGRNSNCGCNQWLTRVQIFTSPNNVDWIDQGSFAGSSDQDSLTDIIFPKSTVCRYVRLEVVSVSNHASARWDVLKAADQSSLVLDMPNLLRANAALNQYAFSSCHAGDAPGSGHCRPQIDSPQGWSSQPSGSGWMSIDLQTPTRVAGVLLQGRSSTCGCNQWLTRIKIDTSADNVNWILHGLFPGNSDQDSKIQVLLQNPIVARYVRITVVSVSSHASARWDVLTTKDQSRLVPAQPKYLRFNPSINQYAFSSCHAGDAPGTGHCRPQIDSVQGWSSQPSGSGWMIIDLRSIQKVAGVMTQGRNSDCGCNQWVSRFSIDYSVDNKDWVSLGNYPGNSDQDTVLETIFANPVKARYIRLSVVSVSNHASMRWDVLSLNENGVSNDGIDFIPKGEASDAVKSSDIFKSVVDGLTKNIATLQSSQAAITQIWQNAQKAQEAAQILFDAAAADLATRKSSMESTSGKVSAAEAVCTTASNAAISADGALAEATSISKSASATNEKEIAIIKQLKDKLTELTNVKLQTSDIQKELRSKVVAVQQSLRASTVSELLIGLDSSRAFAETDTINTLLDQLLAKLRSSIVDANSKAVSAADAAVLAASDRNKKCGTTSALKIELTTATDSWNRATATLRDRTAALQDAKATFSKVNTEYNTAKANFDSEMAVMDKMKKFNSGQLVCTEKR